MELRPLTASPAAQALPTESEPASATARNSAASPAGRAAPASATATAGKPASEQLDKAIAHINKTLSQSDQGVEFSVDKETHLSVVKVVDRETKEVLRQMPSEEALAIARQIDHAQGILIRDKA